MSDEEAEPDVSPDQAAHSWTLEKSAHWGTILQGAFTVLATLLSVGAAFWGYGQWKKEKTLEFQNEWSSLEMINARTSIVDAMMCNLESAAPDDAQAKNPSDPWRSSSFFPPSYLLKIATPAPGYRGLDRELNVALGFYQAVNRCSGSVCDAALACGIFRGDAEKLKVLFEPYLNQQRVIFGPDYGRDFDRFLNSCPADDAQSESPSWMTEEEMKPLREGLASLTQGLRSGKDMKLRARITASCERMKPAR